MVVWNSMFDENGVPGFDFGVGERRFREGYLRSQEDSPCDLPIVWGLVTSKPSDLKMDWISLKDGVWHDANGVPL